MTTGKVDFGELRARLDLADVAEGEGLRVWRRGGPRIIFACPGCGKGGTTARDDSGARARDGVTWGCVRCGEGGDVVDLLRLARGLDAAGAVKAACQLAGLDRETGRPTPGEVWRPRRAPPPPVPEAEPLAVEDLAERMRAVRLAAHHYQILAGLIAGDDWPSAAEHVDFLAEHGAFPRRRDLFNDRLQRVVPGLEENRLQALKYLGTRMGAAIGDARPILAELVGVCPSRNSGLRGYLETMGGAALVDAGARAGLFRHDGTDRFAGRLVYFWTDDGGRVVYLTGRAVPALVDVCNVRRDDKGEVIKGEALPVFAPDRRGDRLGVPAPSAPFGGHLALRRDGPVVIVEGELDAVHELVAGPAVATGGTGRMGNARGVEALRRFLAGREVIVAFDREADPDKQRRTDERAAELAQAIGARWVPGGVAA